MQRAQRTQIYLPQELRKQIDSQRKLSGESLAEYIRIAAEERVKMKNQRKSDIKRLAQELGNSVKKSGWEGMDVLKWQRGIRKDRKII